jgi:hypothetical protein
MRVIIQCIRKKCEETKTAIKENRNQAQPPPIFHQFLFIAFQPCLPDFKIKEQQNGGVDKKASHKGKKYAFRINMQNRCG